MVLASGSTPMGLPGVGPLVAARALADTGDVARFTDREPLPDPHQERRAVARWLSFSTR